MRKILFYTKSPEQIEANSKVFTMDYQTFAKINAESESMESMELEVMTKVFSKRGWHCYWTCLSFLKIETGTIDFFDPIEKSYKTINTNQLNDSFDVIVFRIIGSVEKQRELISNAIDILQSNFNGLIVNHPETIKYAIRKDYILELQAAGFPIIPTIYFENTVTFYNLCAKFDDPGNYVIKPITGECGNSVTMLDRVNENFLRKKEKKVGGWLVQPFIPEVKNEEYHLVFFGQTLSLACKTVYAKDVEVIPISSQASGEINLFDPMDNEIELALAVRAYFQEKLLKPIYSFRFDYLKTSDNEIKILEIEFLNPDFFIAYLENDEAKFNVAYKFTKEITRLCASNGD